MLAAGEGGCVPYLKKACAEIGSMACNMPEVEASCVRRNGWRNNK
jgi:hypothetical protein